MKAIGISQFMEKNFETYEFDGRWLEVMGEPERNFSMLIFGHPKNGKTEFCIQLAKYISRFARVYYNSVEQGISKTLQDALKRNAMHEVAGRVVFGDKESYEEMIERLKQRNSPQIVIVDSRDYANLTARQWFHLVETFPRKSFILVCWESAGKPASAYAKTICYKVDIIAHVRDFKAHIRSRFGSSREPFVIWDKKPAVGDQLKLDMGGAK